MVIKTTSQNGIVLGDNQRLAWLRLYRCENIGPITFRQLIKQFGTAENALENLPDMIKKTGVKKIKIAAKEDIEKEFEQITELGAQVIGIGEPNYPHWLKVADGAPPIIVALGNTDTLCRKSVAFVGSRNASISGLKFTTTLAGEMANNDYTVVSGFARGIDTAAHKASLARGTTAVFAGGIDHIYPQENTKLKDEILENGGCIITENPTGWKPRPQDFPRRNRIVAGLSLAVIVVEAAHKSGSLISARLAADMGRIVLAVPGSPLDPRSHGANNLIREGAILITCVEDILESLTPLDENLPLHNFYGIDEPLNENQNIELPKTSQTHYDKIRQALDFTPIGIDELIRYTGFSTQQVHEVVIAMQITGEIERHSGNKVSLLQKH